jgi:hypothetical protein
VQALVKRVGEENLGFTFLDARRARELFEGLAKSQTTPEKWSEYVKEYQPFLLPFDAARRACARTATSTGSSRSSP